MLFIKNKIMSLRVSFSLDEFKAQVKEYKININNRELTLLQRASVIYNFKAT